MYREGAPRMQRVVIIAKKFLILRGAKVTMVVQVMLTPIRERHEHGEAKEKSDNSIRVAPSGGCTMQALMLQF
jgi:hypothetical protein